MLRCGDSRVAAAWTFASSARSDEESQRRYYSRAAMRIGLVRTPHATSDFFDPIKYPRLTKRRETSFSRSAARRAQYLEFFQNELWGSTGEVDNVSWLQRYIAPRRASPSRVRSMFVLEMACFATGRRVVSAASGRKPALSAPRRRDQLRRHSLAPERTCQLLVPTRLSSSRERASRWLPPAARRRSRPSASPPPRCIAA